MKIIQAYRFALDLTAAHERAVLAHAGAARVAHNWAFALVKAVMDQRAAERSYGIPVANLTPARAGRFLRCASRGITAKSEVAPWWAECSKEAFNTGLDALARALKNWSDSRVWSTCRAAGRLSPVQVPPPVDADGAVHHRRDPGRAGPQACRAAPAGPAQAARVDPQARPPPRGGDGPDHVCHRAPRGRPVARRVLRRGRPATTARPAPARHATVGVDVGVRHLAVLSTGELVPNPRHLDGAARRMRTSRSSNCPAGSAPTGGPASAPSKRWEARRSQARPGARPGGEPAPRRLHKLTTRLAREYGTIVVEDLNVAGMLRNRRLARHIADAGFAELRRQLAYKTRWYGGQLRRCRPLVSLLENLLGLRHGENQAGPVRAHLHLYYRAA